VQEAEIECGDPRVADLLSFVAARAAEDQSKALEASPPDSTLIATCEIVDRVLLDMAREACRAEERCTLPDRCLRALGEYAFTHRSHPDFHPGWARWRLLPAPGL
jgi:hypothetical protein